ncbi:hypothetical protein CYMTET_51072, partial [Cymbomonas tetramitiformis]
AEVRDGRRSLDVAPRLEGTDQGGSARMDVDARVPRLDVCSVGPGLQADLSPHAQHIQAAPPAIAAFTPPSARMLPSDSAVSHRSRLLQERHQGMPGSADMRAARQRLPVYPLRDRLLAAIRDHQVVVVSGPPGCGKSTQLPQYILEEAAAQGEGGRCNVVVTQPRRLAAMAMAHRVACERGEALRDTVGYHIRLDSQPPSTNGGILFCTTGMLVRRCQVDTLLKGVSHVVLDEAHERDLQQDFLLVLLKDMLPQRKDLRVVIMSATLNPHLFCNFFHQCPHVPIEEQAHPVEVLFLEDMAHMLPTGQPAASGASRAPSGGSKEGEEEEEVASAIAVDTVIAVVEHIHVNEEEGAVLVFLPGWQDMKMIAEAMGSHGTLSRECMVVMVHSNLSMEEQQLAFSCPPPGQRKVVLSTNIAETSITIDDVVFVVDSGLVKEKCWSPGRAASSLLVTPVSQASAIQRRGRAGRVRAGKCFHLLGAARFEALKTFSTPEMARLPLESLCLQIKSLSPSVQVASFLDRALEPPEPHRVEAALARLHAIGCLQHPVIARPPSTPLPCQTPAVQIWLPAAALIGGAARLGSTLATFPVDPSVGKMMLLGALIGCAGPALTIAACSAVRDPFAGGSVHKRQVAHKRRVFSDWSRSDHLAAARAYDLWQSAKLHGNERRFLEDSCLSSSALQTIHGVRQQFCELLASTGLSTPSGAFSFPPAVQQAWVKAVLCAALYPGVAYHVGGKRATFRTAPAAEASSSGSSGRAVLHPGSVNYKDKERAWPWLVFEAQLVGHQVLLRGTTAVTPWALLLFGSPTLELHRDMAAVSMDGWAAFKTRGGEEHLVSLVHQVQEEVNAMLELRLQVDIMDPGLPMLQAA